ncbi:protein EMBRYONIC FLOWER 1 isoform X2 [Rhodamnia argentea]|uniref:Protein EMBRYONIC FLOWER 1 isoform X2 n=1 Tax=Rhodamnia argentea TaxID=178133 RepID=A0ABM3H9Q4_9MYRT|nr:protein EMBRYONIC FLOWER 1 isoform X2 [Rhodamnia argentea]
MESFTQIESISIDLLGVAGKSNTKCEHFSIRKYVSGMRQKESKLCWPFKLEKDTLEVPKDMLPPLDVPKFRWWKCQTCIPDICVDSTPAEKAIDDSGFKCKCESARTNLLSQSQTATVASDFQQITNVGIASTGKSNATILPQSNGNDVCAPLYSKEKKDKEDQTCTLISKEVGVSQGKGTDAHGIHVNAESVLNQSNGNRSLHLSMLDCGVHEVVGRASSSEIIQLGKQPSNPDSVKVANGSEYGGVGLIDGVDDAITVQEKKHPSEELDEQDCPSSDSGDLSEDYFHAKTVGLRRRRYRKIRLLTDLLGKDDNTHPDQTRKVNAPCLATCDESVKIGTASATNCPMAAPDNVKKVFKKRKRSLPFDPDSKPMDSMTPSQESGKEIVFKDGAGNSSAIAESQIEDSELARMDSQTVRKNHWAKHKEDAVIRATIKKKKKNHVTEDYFLYKSGQIGAKPADVMFSFGHETSADAAREMNSFLFPVSKNERSLLCKDKTEMSQENGGQVSVAPPSSNPNPSRGMFMRTDSGVMQASPPPFWFIPTSDASVENRSHVSSKSCLLPPKVDKAYATQFGVASSFHWLEGAREDSLMLRNREARQIEPKRPSRCGSDAFLNKGVHDVISKGSTHKIPKVQTEKQNHALNLENSFCYMKPQMDISGTSNREKATKSHEFSATMKQYHDEKSVKASEQTTVDDIPMEIVELMAKNQYERSLDGAGKNKLLPRTSKSIDSGSSRIVKECRNRELNLSQKESIPKRQIHSGNPRSVVVGKDFRSPMQKFVQDSSCPITNYATVGHVEGTPNTARHVMFSQDQGKSAKVRVCVTDPSRQGTNLNGTLNEDISRNKPSDTNFEHLQAPSRTHIPQQGDEPVHLSSSMMPTHMPFVYTIPPDGGLHSNHMDVQSYRPKTPPKVDMSWSQDPRLFSFSATNLEKPSKDFHFDSFSRTCVENPYASRHKGIEVENGYDSFDFRSNETIPAMHLLSLMHAGPSSGQNIDLGGNDRFSKYPSFPRGYHSREIPGRALSLHKPSDLLKCSSSGYCPTNFLPGRYHEHSAVPIVSASASFVQPDKFLGGDDEGRVRLPLKVRDKGKRKFSDLAGPTGGSTFSNRYPGMSDRGNLCRKSGNFFGMPNPRNFSLHEENSGMAKIDTHNRSETTWPPRCSSKPGICTINRNPADFSMPEAGNIYTIGRNDLKFEKKFRFPQKSGLANLDGLKEKSSMRLTGGFRIPQHQLG